MKNILVKKAAVISSLIIILMIALSMISNGINERGRFKQANKHKPESVTSLRHRTQAIDSTAVKKIPA